VIKAAAELFAERSPGQVTIREIAARARVSHSLIHRHFGTKQDLLNAVIGTSTRRYSDRIATVSDPGESFRAGFLFGAEGDPGATTLARVVLEGRTRGMQAGDAFPGMAEHVELLEKTLDARGIEPPFPPKVVAAAAFALIGGWFILEKWLVPAAELDDQSLPELRREVADLLRHFVDAGSGLESSIPD
jgi:AcrR family transcriptional regulator